MKKIILLSIISTIFVVAKIPVIVSIIPQKTFVEAIGGDNVSVETMVMPGNSPHTYEPKPMQMKKVVFAKIYFAIGVEFEDIWVPKFKDLNNQLIVVDTSKGIKRYPMEEKGDKKAKRLDPHIWTTPHSARIIAKNIYKTLTKIDPEHKKEYTSNYKKLIKKINKTDRELKKILRPVKGSRFMVFRPTWGYFARAYHLKQIPIQIAGKSPTPKDLISLIKQARESKVRAIFTQPETPDTIVKVMADELNIPVVRISPMSPGWSENLIRLAKIIAGQPQGQK